MAQETQSTRSVQQTILNIARELEHLDHRLAEVVELVEPDPSRSLLVALIDGTHTVRTDLLSDAIDSLITLGHQTEEGALRRSRQLGATAETLMTM